MVMTCRMARERSQAWDRMGIAQGPMVMYWRYWERALTRNRNRAREGPLCEWGNGWPVERQSARVLARECLGGQMLGGREIKTGTLGWQSGSRLSSGKEAVLYRFLSFARTGSRPSSRIRRLYTSSEDWTRKSGCWTQSCCEVDNLELPVDLLLVCGVEICAPHFRNDWDDLSTETRWLDGSMAVGNSGRALLRRYPLTEANSRLGFQAIGRGANCSGQQGPLISTCRFPLLVQDQAWYGIAAENEPLPKYPGVAGTEGSPHIQQDNYTVPSGS
jgi:hypothetical protein